MRQAKEINKVKFMRPFRLLLVDSVGQITGGESQCSNMCKWENKNGYKFEDDSRVQFTNCPHYSRHIQCQLTNLINKNLCYQWCQINDTPQCRSELDQQGKRGEGHYWCAQDYKNLVIATLRNSKLASAFVKPEF